MYQGLLGVYSYSNLRFPWCQCGPGACVCVRARLSVCSLDTAQRSSRRVQVEVVDPVADYLATLREVFDFPLLRDFLARPDFSLTFDAMHAVTGAYAGPILVDALGAPASSILCGPLGQH